MSHCEPSDREENWQIPIKLGSMCICLGGHKNKDSFVELAFQSVAFYSGPKDAIDTMELHLGTLLFEKKTWNKVTAIQIHSVYTLDSKYKCSIVFT